MPDPTPDRRWTLLRSLLVFQVKLAVDALRDVVLSPVSIFAALLDLVTGTDREPLYFEQVLAAGRRSEAWINLFEGVPETEHPGMDRLVRRVEALMVEQYERGGITAQAKDAIDRSLDVLAGRKQRPGAAPGSDPGPEPPAER